MSTDIVQYEGLGSSLTLWRAPEQVLADAKKAADALVSVISQKKDKVTFNGEQYLEREDWGTVAKFYGCTAKTISTNYVNYDGVKGFEATAVCIDANQNEIGRAESMCLSDEANWGDVPVYEWQDELDAEGKKIWVEGKDGKKRPKGKRVQTGTTPKPLFQLRSMAQTRAEAKVLKSVFGYVVVLAGYKPTPAEEMTRSEERFEDRTEGKKTVTQPTRASEKATKEADTKTSAVSTTTGSTTSGNAAATEEKGMYIIDGEIEQAKKGKDSDIVWLSLKTGFLVQVRPDKFDADMVPKTYIKLRGGKTKGRGDLVFYELLGLIELTPIQEGEVVTTEAAKPEEQKMAPDAAAVAAEMFPDTKPLQSAATGKEVVKEMVDNGQLKPASRVEGPKTIGVKRAQRIWSLINQNKANNNGFNEEEMKRILQSLPHPLEHLRDLEIAMYEQVEKWSTGEDDWREFWKD